MIQVLEEAFPRAIVQICLFTERMDKSRSRQAVGGCGIGLMIASAFVGAHGGRIWVEAAGNEKGSVFTFTLPIAR